MCNLWMISAPFFVVAVLCMPSGTRADTDRIAFINNCPGRVVFFLKDDSSNRGYDSWNVEKGQSLVLDLNPESRGPFSIILRTPHDDAFFMDHLDLRSLINDSAGTPMQLAAEYRGYWYNYATRGGRQCVGFKWVPESEREVVGMMVSPQPNGPATIGTVCSHERPLPYPPPPPKPGDDPPPKKKGEPATTSAGYLGR